MSANKKLKVVWVCHFSNDDIQSLLPLWRSKNEFAPWIPNMLKGFEGREDIDLYVISPHEYLKRTTKFVLKNIKYYFIPYGVPVWHRHWPRFFRFDIYSNHFSFRRKLKRLIKVINPDIINLIGAENSYYSSSIFDYHRKYPILITIQGFISQLKDELPATLDIRDRIQIEEKILANSTNFCGEQDSSSYIAKFNPNHVFFKYYAPINEEYTQQALKSDPKYDCIYFGTLSKLKGTEEYIKVIAELKKSIPEVKACIIGPGNPQPFLEIAEHLNCANNIEFAGFSKNQKELFRQVKAAKVFLAPPLKERLSMTIREAIFLKVPIVAYATGGIPYINKFDENIFLVKTGDYKEMARKVKTLLQDDQLRNNLAEKAFRYGINEFGLQVNTERLIAAYKSILSRNNTI